jgi:heme-degrading monooxygenase HmoA
MHVRITTATDVNDIDALLALTREEVLPTARQQKGFRGVSVSGDRTAGVVYILTQWDSEADLDASESMAEKARGDAMKAMGGRMAVDRFEQLLWEADRPPAPGMKLQITEIKMDPARIDDNFVSFRDSVVPDMKSAAGFVSVRHMIKRDTGEGRVGSVWADDESVQAWRTRTEERRAIARERGVQFGEDRLLEILFAAMD